MAKFCGKCGTVINEITGLCPNCNPEFNKQIFNQENNNVMSNKKGKKFKKIIALCLALLVLVGTVSILLCTNIIKLPFGDISNSTEKDVVLNINETDYYFSGLSTPLIINDENIALPIIEDDEYCGIVRDSSVRYGNNIFAMSGDDRENLYKFTFLKDGKIKKSVWLDEFALKNSDVFKGKEYVRPQIMTNWQLDGEYIYFTYIPGIEYITTESEDAYRLGRISKDGTNIEFIEDTIASDYVVNDGWIYFYDNGYEGGTIGSYDHNREGLYKMRVNGTDRQLLYGDLEKGTDDDRGEDNPILISDIEIYGEQLYFIDHSANGESRICRMNKDGKDREYVTDEGAFSYTIDDKMENIYYSTGKYGMSQVEPRAICQVSLNDSDKSELFYYNYGNPDFTYYNNCLYFDCRNFGGINNPSGCGMKYDIDNEKIYKLVGTQDIKTKFDEDGFPVSIESDPVFKWEEDTNIREIN